TLVDTTPPTIGQPGAAATIDCTATPSFTAPTASDDCNGTTINILGDVTGGTGCVGTVTRSWDAVDACGNHSATVSQTITLIDTTTPSFTATTASDDCNGATINQLTDVTGGTGCVKTVTRSWDAVDACGNHSATVSQTITLIDTTPPTIGTPGAPATIDCTATPSFT